MNADGSRQKIADGHPCTVSSVKKQRISQLELLLHGVAARTRPGTAPSDGATQFPRVDEDIYAPLLRCCAAQLGEQPLSEVMKPSEASNPSPASNPTTRLIHTDSELIRNVPGPTINFKAASVGLLQPELKIGCASPSTVPPLGLLGGGAATVQATASAET